MNKLILTVITVVLSGMLFAAEVNAQGIATQSSLSSVPGKSAILTWEKTTMDLGKVPQNVPVTINYSFTNTGDAPLVLTNVQTSCGCTISDFTKESIAPGKKGFVKLTYNASSVGVFSKSATVTANTDPGVITLLFNGEVVVAGNK